MTEKEAIKWIKKHHDTEMDNCKDSEAMRIAIECIKKQVPMKPRIKSFKNVDYKFYICPDCGYIYGEGVIGRCCQNCGQKIDWSKEK